MSNSQFVNRSKVIVAILLVTGYGLLVTTPASAQNIVPIPNPAGNYAENIGDIIERVAQFIAYLAFPLVAAMIIFAGIRFLLARGNEQKVQEAKETLKWAILGAAIVIGAYAIVLTLRTIF